MLYYTILPYLIPYYILLPTDTSANLLEPPDTATVGLLSACKEGSQPYLGARVPIIYLGTVTKVTYDNSISEAYMAVSKKTGHFLGVPTIRIRIHWGLYNGPHFLKTPMSGW